ncbi:DUF1302 domain-containing protein [Endozoicomonas numazuensis]|uniref:DUF1302 domain-containing protein n=1 Tax=Endozoicomonas numazuensis TaxID=1137799 RepID=A0A081NLU9_9GAMM|nr:DUF1302 family protein [Endozoicomonas numazuensis]KEQ19422.1 hypothetical protein GZ78_05585 [Endozoicomonas numazuensis]
MTDEPSVVARTSVRALQLAPKAAGFLLTGSIALTSAHAYEFDFADGDIQGSLNTTISIGAKYDLKGYETPEDHNTGALTHDENINDGLRSFDGDFVSKVFRASSELELKKENYGLFVRGTAFYDDVLMNGNNKWVDNNADDVAKGLPDETGTFNGWSDKVKDNQGRGAKFQQAYVYGSWAFEGDKKLKISLGDQVHNWGETIFYGGGLMDLNAYDGALASMPGSTDDLKLAQGMLKVDFDFNDQVSLATFIQYDWEASILPGRGTFGQDTDLFVPGSEYGYYTIESVFAPLGFKPTADQLNAILGAGAATSDYIKVADVSATKDARNDGQWGARLSFTPESLPDTEIALYYANYHSSIPTIDIQANSKVLAETQGLAASGLGAFAPANLLANNVNARASYVEDIEIWAASFNTKVFGYTQIAGELSYRPDAPIWIDHPDDILTYGYAGAARLLTSGDGILAGEDIPISVADPARTISANNQWYQNYTKVDLWDGSLSVIQPFGAVLGTDLMYVVTEAAFQLVGGLDDYDRYVAKGSNAYAKENPSLNADERLDRLSWGYNVMLGANWNNVLTEGFDIESTLRFTHDVSGNSHRTGRFEEGEKKLTLGVTGKYDDIIAKLSWEGDASTMLRKGVLVGSIGYTF